MAKIESPAEFLSSLLEEYGLNPFKVSKDIQLSQSAVRLLVLGKTRISVPVALRLAKYFGSTPESWLTMQMKWDLSEASKDKELTDIVKNIAKAKKEPAPAKTTAKKAGTAKAAGKAGTKKEPAAKKGAAKAPRKPAAKAK